MVIRTVIILRDSNENFEKLAKTMVTLRDEVYACIDLTEQLIAEAAAYPEGCAASDWMAHLQGQATAYKVVATKLDTIIGG